jgi:tRNA threonylcarbamoyladenosine biosynthesis protein TsaE
LTYTAADLTLTVETHSEEATEALGRRIGARLRAGDCVALVGPLGAGKTALARGIAQGAGASGYMASPSFVLIREYAGPVRVFHADLYRLERRGEIDTLGLDDLVGGDGIVLIEWADHAPWLLPDDHVRIECALGATPTERVFTVTMPATLRLRLEAAVSG